jgi:hypothetical protein
MIIEDPEIRHPRRDLYSFIHRASIPPEQAFLVLG